MQASTPPRARSPRSPDLEPAGLGRRANDMLSALFDPEACNVPITHRMTAPPEDNRVLKITSGTVTPMFAMQLGTRSTSCRH
jgi:hypothetical protein